MINNPLVKSIVVLTTWLFAICPFLVFAQHLNLLDRRFYKMSSTSLVGKVTETQQVKDFFDCSFLCLERGPFVCLSFNLDKADDNGYYTCELSSSERYLEPQRIQQPSSYDYYGTTTEVLSVVHTYFLINSTHINWNHDQNTRLQSEPICSLKFNRMATKIVGFPPENPQTLF